MRGLVLALACAAVMAITAFAAGVAAPTADAHRSWCHSKHSCPSDHATYRWGPKQLLCVKPSSDKRDSSFRQRVGYEGLNYYCKR